MTDRNRTIALLLAFPGLMGLLAGSAAHGSPSLAPQIRSVEYQDPVSSRELCSSRVPGDQALPVELAAGEAEIHYLYHSGWAIRTANHFLVFDSVEHDPGGGERSLATGFVVPSTLRGLRVTVFVSHAHGDHFDRSVLSWEKDIPGLTYVFGFPMPSRPGAVQFGPEREHKVLDGLEVWNIHHEADGIPESASLVRVDGLIIFHGGDHGTSANRPMRPDFKDNIEYLAGLGLPVDLAFLAIWGYTKWQLETLGIRNLFPMHEGGREDRLEKDARRLAAEGVTVPIHAARRPGARFVFKDGFVRRADPSGPGRTVRSCRPVKEGEQHGLD